MPAPDLMQEAGRQMLICNACRYCEGYCAVWPSIELRRNFAAADIEYLAHLCFDCRACFYACQYAPPHEFDVNPPKIFAEVRRGRYVADARPPWSLLMAGSLGTLVSLTLAGVVAVLAVAFAVSGAGAVFGRNTGAGSFYRVIPYDLMVVPFVLLMVYWLGVWVRGGLRFWRSMGPLPPGAALGASAVWRATADAVRLTYLDGGGDGCTYPTARFSRARRWFHHLVFYGFLLDVASTTLAAIYDHVFAMPAPYPLFHVVVVLGTLGGAGLVAGTMGLLYLKTRNDRVPSDPGMVSFDTAFVLLLFVVAATGLLLLALRETPAMGTLLAVHLGTVVVLFVAAPYGKFLHVVYRYVALLRYAAEQQHAEAAAEHATK